MYLIYCVTIYCIEEQGYLHMCSPEGMRGLMSGSMYKGYMLLLISFLLLKFTMTLTRADYQPGVIFFTVNQCHH